MVFGCVWYVLVILFGLWWLVGMVLVRFSYCWNLGVRGFVRVSLLDLGLAFG